METNAFRLSCLRKKHITRSTAGVKLFTASFLWQSGTFPFFLMKWIKIKGSCCLLSLALEKQRAWKFTVKSEWNWRKSTLGRLIRPYTTSEAETSEPPLFSSLSISFWIGLTQVGNLFLLFTAFLRPKTSEKQRSYYIISTKEEVALRSVRKPAGVDVFLIFSLLHLWLQSFRRN